MHRQFKEFYTIPVKSKIDYLHFFNVNIFTRNMYKFTIYPYTCYIELLTN